MKQVQCPNCFATVHLPDEFSGGDVMCSSCDTRFTVDSPRPEPEVILAASVSGIAKWFFIALGASILLAVCGFAMRSATILWLSSIPIAAFHAAAVIYGLAYLRTIALK